MIAIVGSNINSALDALHEKHHAEELVAHNQVTDMLLQAARYWAAERSLTAAVLATPTTINAQQTKTLGEHRAAADKAYEDALTYMKDLAPFNEEDTLVAAVKKDFTELQAMRSDADQSATQVATQRSSKVARHVNKKLTDLIDDTQNLFSAVDFRRRPVIRRLSPISN